MTKVSRFIIILLFFTSFISFSYAQNITFVVDELNRFKQIDNGNYQLYSEGVVVIRNPSSISKIYELEIPLQLDSLMGINKIRTDPSADNFTVTYNRITSILIDPGEEVEFGYEIFGVVDYDLQTQLIESNISVFEYYAQGIYPRSNTVISLDKAQREGTYYFQNGSIENQTSATNTSRLVSVNMRNPTDFTYIFDDVKLYESTSGDPMFSDAGLVANYGNFTLDAFEFVAIDYYDTDSSDYAVYWTSYNPYIATDFSATFVWEQSGKLGGGSSSGGSSSSSSTPEDIEELENKIIIKKEVDKSLVLKGDKVEVTLRVVNLNGREIQNITLFDEIPDGYTLEDVSSRVKIEGRSRLVFDIDSIDEYGTYVIKYTLTNNDALRGITYLKPASATFNDEVFYSEGVLLVNDLLPNKKIFIQKEIEYEDDDFARVTIRVKNLGSVDVQDILVSDIIDENSLIREISKVFIERGVWRINELKAGEEWVVSYLVERNAELENLPNLFGVEEAEVYHTLIQSEEVVTIFQEQPRTVETVGMALAVGLLIFYLLF